MKQILPLIAIFGLTLACAPPQKTNQNGEQAPTGQNEKRIHIEKQIAPGTCSLQLTNCTILEENSKTYLLGNVNSINSYGAGFTSTFVKDQKLKITITEQQFKHLQNSKSISCLISNAQGIKNESILTLVDYQHPIEK
jgi:hypothetical protein